MFEVIDSVLDINDFQKLKDEILSPATSWQLNAGIVGSEKSNLDDLQFVHMVYHHQQPMSPLIKELGPLATGIGAKINLRIKINMTAKTVSPYRSGFHTDLGGLDDLPHKTAVYYMNDNNGYTEFENGERVYSKANRAVIFDGQTMHSGVSCTDAKYRCVINWNFL